VPLDRKVELRGEISALKGASGETADHLTPKALAELRHATLRNQFRKSSQTARQIIKSIVTVHC
jgi:hypothetical protein